MDNGESSYRRFLSGDDSGFEAIMDAWFDNLIFFIRRYVRDPAAAEDIAIDVFADVLAHPRRYHFKVSVKTYLFMLGRSRALNYLKRRSRFTFVELEQAEQVADRTTLEEQLLLDERRRAVHAALGKLPEEQRVAVHLRFFEELSYEEVARVMKKSPKQVDNLLYRAKKELRAILGKEEELL